MKKTNQSEERFIYFMRLACSNLSDAEFLKRLKKVNTNKVKNGNR